jgi:hypothetical protein
MVGDSGTCYDERVRHESCRSVKLSGSMNLDLEVCSRSTNPSLAPKMAPFRSENQGNCRERDLSVPKKQLVAGQRFRDKQGLHTAGKAKRWCRTPSERGSNEWLCPKIGVFWHPAGTKFLQTRRRGWCGISTIAERRSTTASRAGRKSGAFVGSSRSIDGVPNGAHGQPEPVR